MRAIFALVQPVLLVAAVIVVVGSMDTPALALTALEQACKDGPPDTVIEACSKLLARKESKTLRAIRFNNRAIAYRNKNECDRAIDDYNSAIELDPKKDNFRLRRANLLHECKTDYDLAIVEMNALVKKLPTERVVYFNRGLVYIKKEQYDLARLDFQKAIELKPQDASAHNSLGDVQKIKGEYDSAIATFSEAIRLTEDKEDRSMFYTNRGEAKQLRGDLDGALADFNEALSLFPDRALTLVFRGALLRYRNALDKSLADLDNAVRVGPDFPFAYAERGLTQEKQGNILAARKDFEKVLSLAPKPVYYETSASARKTATSRLAALDSGAPQPVIAPVPFAATGQTSIPTSALSAPILTKPVAPEQVKATAINQGRRVALVIGNSSYKNVSQLNNPQKDAAVVATALRNIGFDTVVQTTDASREKLSDALRAFAEQSEKADWAVVYYAGHGIEVGGVNYLVPVDAKLAADRDVQFEAVSLDQVLASVEGAKKIKLVVLDACRDNPFTAQMRRTIATRSIGRGLSRVEPDGATLVVYAAKHGQTALDGSGNNSPFAQALVNRIATPGVEINKIFRLVRDDVMEATAGRQEPFTYGSLPGREDFFFVAGR